MSAGDPGSGALPGGDRLAWLSRPRTPTWTDRGVAAALFGVTLAALLATSTWVGVARDEGIYIHGAMTYWQYGEAVRRHPDKRFDRRTIDRYYHVNAEHPPLTKHLYGLAWAKLRTGPVDKVARAREARAARRGLVPPLSGSLRWLDDLTALRLPALVTAALLVAFLYLFGVLAFGRMAGLVAALSYAVLPRVFFHSHLAGLDGPITALLFFTVYAYYRALWSWRWTVVAGLLWGLALLTKLNAFFLPVILIVHYGWASRRDFRHPLLAFVGLGSLLPLVLLSLAAAVSSGGRHLGPWLAVAGFSLLALWAARRHSLSRPLHAARLLAPAVFFSMLLLGGVVFYAGWPWLWPDPTARFGGYLHYHLEHTFYNTEYLGRNYNLPPFPMSYPFVLSAAVFPGAWLLAALVGLGLALRGPAAVMTRLLGRPASAWRAWWAGAPMGVLPPEARDVPGRGWGRPLRGLDRAPAALVGLNAIFWIGIIALPSTPIFGGARLWMPSWPFLALLAGWGAQAVWRPLADRLGRASLRLAVAVALLAALVVPGLTQTVHAGDVAPSWYSPLVGGPAGAADLGLKRQYWGYTTRRLLPALNRLAEAAPRATRAAAPRRARRWTPVYFHDTNRFSRNLYARIGLLSPAVTYAGDGFGGIRRSRVALFLHERHQVMWEYRIWQDYGTVRPARVLTLDGVPLVMMYRRPAARPPRRPPYFEPPPGG